MRKNRIVFIFFLAVFIQVLISCGGEDKKSKESTNAQTQADWEYFGLPSPGSVPQLFSPDILSTRRNERDIAISPKGNEIYYTLVLPAKNLSVILYMRFDGFFWSEPQIASFSGRHNDLVPSFSPDGKKLFFISDKPLTGETEKEDFDIWYIDLSGTRGMNPINIGSPVNTEKNEYFPSVTSDGTIYFTASYDSLSKEDIYFARLENNEYTEPVRLGESINTTNYEFNSFISPDESFLLFSSYGREDDLGGGDIYISHKLEDGSWSQAQNMGYSINSDKLDYCPFVTYDGKYMFFTSERMDRELQSNYHRDLNKLVQLSDGIENGLGNIYWVEFGKRF